MKFELRAHTILLTVVGSRCYGLHTAASDVDLKGVAVPPARYFHGYLESFEQADATDHMSVFLQDLRGDERGIADRTKLEGSIYNLVKFVRLAADCNPNILDVLFCRDDEVRRVDSLGAELRGRRELFLSAKARFTYAGYATAQLKRIRGHRSWLLDPPRAAPTRADFDLPERTLIPRDQLVAARAAVRARMDSWELDLSGLPKSETIRIQSRIEETLGEVFSVTDSRWRCAARAIGLDDNFIALMDRERRYRAARNHFDQYNHWKRSRNPARAELEALHGYDTKHGAHLVRLLRMGREVLETGELHVWRGGRDADELLAIRDGQWSYEQLVEWAEEQDAAIKGISCLALPEKPDREAIDSLCVNLVERAIDARRS